MTTSNEAQPPNPVVPSKASQPIPEFRVPAGEPAQFATCGLYVLCAAVERESNRRAFFSSATSKVNLTKMNLRRAILKAWREGPTLKARKPLGNIKVVFVGCANCNSV